MPDAVIVSAVRSPIGRANKGVLRNVRADDLDSVAVKAAVDRVPQLDRSLIEDVWELLAQPSNYDRWWDAHLVRSEPEGPATLGQISYATTKEFGKQWDVTFVVKSIQPTKHQIQLDVTLPLGIIDHATLTCTPVDAVSCRVQFG